jgi:hypothetical protein
MRGNHMVTARLAETYFGCLPKAIGSIAYDYSIAGGQIQRPGRWTNPIYRWQGIRWQSLLTQMADGSSQLRCGVRWRTDRCDSTAALYTREAVHLSPAWRSGDTVLLGEHCHCHRRSWCQQQPQWSQQFQWSPKEVCDHVSPG